MGRGKIEIKRIENQTNRQVTYSKRRNGIFKKAQELTVLCDAKVSIIMFSSTGKFHEYTSPSITTKKIYDQYQKALDTDLWSSHYEIMQENLRKLKEINNRLSREIRQRVGEDLNGLSLDDLRSLQNKVSSSLDIVRARKVKNLEERHGNLLLDLRARLEDPQYGLVDNEGDYESTIALTNGASNLYAFRLHSSHLDLHHAGGFETEDLRLA
nr:floral homeotic protein DEFICIENS-like isoform X2 [Quercus suber]XP_023922131.1 floral homeotic protein DEFICIENS-like isoform X2 [Quercus suber]POF11838.1 floral homeotic protein deficiens [Quercus suber]